MTVSHRSRNFLAKSVWMGGLTVFGLLAASCADPEGAFDDFTDRQDAIQDAAAGGSGGTGTGGTGNMGGAAGGGAGGAGGNTCTPLQQGDVAEGYLFSLSAVLLPNEPFVADATVTMDEGANTISFSIQPLNADDKTTPVGDPILGGPYQVQPDGSFEADFGEISMVGDANPISGNDLVTTLTLIAEPGGWCKESDFVCGDAVGKASKPLSIKLEGSTFTFQRLDGSGYPGPVLNCAGETP